MYYFCNFVKGNFFKISRDNSALIVRNFPRRCYFFKLLTLTEKWNEKKMRKTFLPQLRIHKIADIIFFLTYDDDDIREENLSHAHSNIQQTENIHSEHVYSSIRQFICHLRGENVIKSWL